MTLDAVRLALQADAGAERDALLAAADRAAAATIAAAWHRAEDLREAAQAEGAAQARASAAIELARARRAARHEVLRARSEEHERARAAVRAAARELRSDPRYPALVEALEGLARSQLGPDAVVSVDDRDGGVVARAGSRTVDYRLPEIAQRCFDAAGPEVEALWR